MQVKKNWLVLFNTFKSTVVKFHHHRDINFFYIFSYCLLEILVVNFWQDSISLQTSSATCAGKKKQCYGWWKNIRLVYNSSHVWYLRASAQTNYVVWGHVWTSVVQPSPSNIDRNSKILSGFVGNEMRRSTYALRTDETLLDYSIAIAMAIIPANYIP